MPMDTILFESWRGRYADSPRAISERLRETRDDLRHVWVVDRPDVRLPDGVDRVLRHSPAYFRHLVTARHLVSNDMISRHYVHGPRTTYLQTWHGTPLKRIGFDVPAARYAEAATYRRRLARDVRAWDYLVSPNPYSTAVFRRAFRYDGAVLETGYPRNDVLRRPDRAALRERVRRELGVADGVRAVLYAPTWRDDARDATGRPTLPPALDLAELERLLPAGTVLLLRMHRLVADRLPATAPGFARDVSDHPDIAELYLAADVLVTDYSSAMFDFAVTGRPMVFFAYDLEAYRDEVRGFYFDFTAEAPGPIVRHTAEVAEAIVNLAAVQADYRVAYRAFVAKFCPLEDGGATDRVLDAVFPETL
jgi:CDP-glycerol glycerophosphotransferase